MRLSSPTLTAEADAKPADAKPADAKAPDAKAPDATNNWAMLLDRHGPSLLMLARQLGDRSTAEDAVQEGFVRFWRGGSAAADPVAYLFACVRTAALDAARGSDRRTQRQRAAARAEIADQPAPADASVASERGSAVAAAIEQLPSEQREVLVMRVWGELSFPQIAAAVGTPVDTAASRHRAALAALRPRLAAFAPEARAPEARAPEPPPALSEALT